MFGIFYRIGIELYFLLVRIVSFSNKKASLFIKGRQSIFSTLATLEPKTYRRIWFHCASLGEFEQAKPIIEQLKTQQPHIFIAVSFFSPSGFEPSKNYQHADWVGYIPKDTSRNANRIISLLQPDCVVFVKYEIWYFLLRELHKQKIATYLVSAKFRKGGLLNPYIKSFFLPLLKGIKKIYLQDVGSYQILKDEGLKQIEITGDTRVDRVIALAAQEFDTTQFEIFVQHSKVLIGGSTWQQEEDLLFEAMQTLPEFIKLIIAPHDIKRSKDIAHKFEKFGVALLSQWQPDGQVRVVIVDSIGQLSKLYRIANIAFIGGGFNNSLHNIYEPAVYGIPVLYGNNTPKFPEADLFYKNGMGFPIRTAGELYKLTLSSDDFYKTVKSKSAQFFENNRGVCTTISTELLQ